MAEFQAGSKTSLWLGLSVRRWSTCFDSLSWLPSIGQFCGSRSSCCSCSSLPSLPSQACSSHILQLLMPSCSCFPSQPVAAVHAYLLKVFRLTCCSCSSLPVEGVQAYLLKPDLLKLIKVQLSKPSCCSCSRLYLLKLFKPTCWSCSSLSFLMSHRGDSGSNHLKLKTYKKN